jgi:hypothetical protein
LSWDIHASQIVLTPVVNLGEFAGGEITEDCNIFIVQWVVVGKLLCYAIVSLTCPSILLRFEGTIRFVLEAICRSRQFRFSAIRDKEMQHKMYLAK